ncbi:MAG TPA: CdaR family protein [Candidatus Limiplasma sp.]|nr:CdaR family protein [Candidatus Limiplasma sp.]
MSTPIDETKPVSSEKRILKHLSTTFPKRLWSAVTHNLQWKLLALFLALLLWVGLILQDPSLTRERVFTGVPVTITGSDTLRRNGFIVTQGLEEANAVVKLKVDVPQQQFNEVNAQNYAPRIDLSRITEAGEQTVKVATTSSTLYGNVTDVSPTDIPIVVDAYVTNFRITVQVSVVGDYPMGFYGTDPVTDVSTVTVSGPESIVSRIAKIVLEYDVSLLDPRASRLQTALALHYVDIDNNELDATLLEPTSGGVLLRSIVVEQSLYPVKSISLSQTALTTGTPKAGFEVKSVTLSPETIIAAGDQNTLSTLDTLFAEKPIDVEGLDTTFTAEIKVTQPDNIVYMSTHTVKLTVEIGQTLQTVNFDQIPVSVTGLSDGMSAVLQTQQVSVALTGPSSLMSVMNATRIKASVDADGVSSGTFELPVTLEVFHNDAQQFTYTIEPQSVIVTLSDQ